MCEKCNRVIIALNLSILYFDTKFVFMCNRKRNTCIS